MRIALILLLLILVASPGNTTEQPIIEIKGPTVIAFFMPLNDETLTDDFDTNVALDDFKFYASKARESLKKAAIDFKEVNSKSFRVRDGMKEIVFQSKEANFGYYFISPGMKAVVKYGVMTEVDLFECAHQYFGIVVQ
jgi:hypothetical protein